MYTNGEGEESDGGDPRHPPTAERNQSSCCSQRD